MTITEMKPHVQSLQDAVLTILQLLTIQAPNMSVRELVEATAASEGIKHAMGDLMAEAGVHDCDLFGLHHNAFDTFAKMKSFNRALEARLSIEEAEVVDEKAS